MEIKQRLLPDGRSNKPNKPMKPMFITVHETDNTDIGADAERHASYILNGSGGRQASWHYTVDDKQVYQHLRTNEQGWHAGDKTGKGNTQSIGIETCVNVDGDYEKTLKNVAWLVSKLMKDHNIPLENVVPHKHWSGKNCPQRLLKRWDDLVKLIKGTSAPTVAPAVDVYVNGVNVGKGDIINGVTRCPVRSVAQALGAYVVYDPNTKRVDITKK
ncbi:N-acetylmuramoyl-L-alanine amidase [Paenibacillus alvei]|uniref:N-acetylmuramoyl-L-alanine amidase n=1 Tax=Paenibacillus alvei TaxID=44250 RepID=UPI00228140CC|nr:N-acetylmuramoyl-L-alanine amidase [Paenibacillus alvei]MCY7487945.1 N-acetylmuramoyl-L-alanine amidase [Paenibacillus alvei]